jgi:hypothetical protein
MVISTAESARGLGRFMRLDHHRLTAVFRSVIDAFRARDHEAMRAAWCRLEQAVLGHLGAEERYALPRFSRRHRDEAAALLRDHEHFRRQLSELGVGVELRLLDLHAAEAFIAELEAHAEREERLLYAWADAEMGPGACAAVEREVAGARREG